MENICRFVPVNHTPDVIQTLHFVYETQKTEEGCWRTATAARVHYVTEGSAFIECNGLRKEVAAGDLFFILPAVTYRIEGDQDFKYMYISYMGLRAGVIMDRLNINSRHFIFRHFKELEPLWQECIGYSEEFSDLASEALLLHIFAKIGEKTAANRESELTASGDRFLKIKKYIDDHFSEPELSLDKLSHAFSYNKKYLSTAFKKHFKVGLTDYINLIRINYACQLIHQNYTGVSDIAFLCGFRDAMYFSKVFKKITGQSPKNYISTQ